MSTSRLSVLAGLEFDPDSFSGTTLYLGGMRRQMIRSGLDVQQECTSGSIYSTFQSIYAGAPMAEFSTVDVKYALNIIGTTGLAIAAATHNGLTFRGQQKQEGGSRKSGNVHVSYNIKEGMVVPRRLTCAHQKDAQLDAETLITWDGTNSPIVQSNTSPYTATSYLDYSRLTIGKVQLGTSNGDKFQINQIQNIEVVFDIQAVAEGSDSDVFPTFVSINEIPKPMIRITCSDPFLLSASNGIPLNGKDLSAAYSKIVFRQRKRLTNSGFYDDTDTVHLAITPLVGCAYLSDIGDYGGNSSNGQVIIEIPLISNGTDAPWSFSTTATNQLP